VPAAAKQAAEKVFHGRRPTSAAKAATENKPVIAALKRCATQNQGNTECFRNH
jgi:hypothetical protein